MKQGETVLDLGSGGGLDCFLAAKAVGGEGQVIGVDSTPEMVYRARENAEKANLKNVEFRLGEIENLPVSDHSVDVVISNCVINLSPEKTKVFKEAYRVLKNGGRFAILDMVATAPLPNEVKKDYGLYTGCLAGAAEIKQIESMLEKAGFINIRIRLLGRKNDPTQDREARRKIEDWVISASIEGLKPSKR